MPVDEIAYAKINLALHVRRREPDGYHTIETLFAFAEDGDRLTLRDEAGLTVGGPFADAIGADRDNLVLRAAEGFAQLLGHCAEYGFLLDKRLPVAAGIGGGSADAAAALRLLCRTHDVDLAAPEILRLALALGADVPACLRSEPVRGEGRGDRLSPAEGLPAALPLLLVNPRLALSTAAVFARWDGVDRGPLAAGSPLAAAQAGRNDLEPPARALRPEIGDVLASLERQPGTRLTRMSGSGATCFALFDDPRACDAAACAIAAEQPGWWVMRTRLR